MRDVEDAVPYKGWCRIPSLVISTEAKIRAPIKPALWERGEASDKAKLFAISQKRAIRRALT